MKTLLLINNYDMNLSRELYLQGNSPSHHLFGTNELIETGKYKVDYALITTKNVNNKILKLLSLIPVWLKLYKKALKYDYVYGAADFTVDFLAIAKKIGLFRPKLIAIFHHPPFEHKLMIEKFDSIIFLSHYSNEEMRKKFPRIKFRMNFIQWGPDLNFYSKIAPIPNYKKEEDEIIFISNGKTRRDHEALVAAAEETRNKTIIVSDQNNLPTNHNKSCKYTSIYYQKSPNDIKMVELLNKCSVLVIPTHTSIKRLGPIGLTSFVDAIALGMPIIASSNTAFADIIEKENMGFIYNSGDILELKECMSKFRKKPSLIREMGVNAYKYGLTHDIKHFEKNLRSIIEHL